MRRTTKKSLVSPTFPTRNNTRRNLSLLKKPSSITRRAITAKRTVIKVDMVTGNIMEANKKVKVVIIKEATKIKDATKAAKDATEATMMATVKTVNTSPIVPTNNLEKAKNVRITTEKEDKAKAVEEVETGKIEDSVTNRETFMTCVKSTTKLR